MISKQRKPRKRLLIRDTIALKLPIEIHLVTKNRIPVSFDFLRCGNEKCHQRFTTGRSYSNYNSFVQSPACLL